MQWSDEEYGLGVEKIDARHRQFLELLDKAVEQDNATFKAIFNEINEHLIEHFSEEEALMDEYKFSASAEHKGEHKRILGEMNQFKRQIERGRNMMARAYLMENLPSWFSLHVTTMDSALAAQINAK